MRRSSGSFGPDGDEILIRGQPVDHVQQKIAIAAEAERLIGGPARISDHDEAPGIARLGPRVGARDGQRERAVLVLGRIDANLRRGEIVVAKLSADVENSLVIVVLSVFLVSSERDSGKAVEMFVRSFTMGCESYCRITGAVGPAAQQLRRGAFVQQQVLVGGDAPAFQQSRRGPCCR